MKQVTIKMDYDSIDEIIVDDLTQMLDAFEATPNRDEDDIDSLYRVIEMYMKPTDYEAFLETRNFRYGL